MYFIYRITPRGKIEWVDTFNQASIHVVAFIEDHYLPDSAAGELYFVINPSTGAVTHQFVVQVAEPPKFLIEENL